MKKSAIVRFSAEQIRERAKARSETDWSRVDKLADADIDAANRGDTDWREFTDVDWSAAHIVLPPEKQAISIRLDRDVVDFFKTQGSGYQTRINAVLRHFMESKSRKTG